MTAIIDTIINFLNLVLKILDRLSGDGRKTGSEAQLNKRLNIHPWWPKDNETVTGAVKFQAEIREGFQNISTPNLYDMYWSVDSHRLNPMVISYEISPHYEDVVDVSDWRWNRDGNYRVTFTAIPSSTPTATHEGIIKREVHIRVHY